MIPDNSDWEFLKGRIEDLEKARDYISYTIGMLRCRLNMDPAFSSTSVEMGDKNGKQQAE